MDYDQENNLFIAHPGWYNDAVVHYYKFRIFAPSTYPDVIAPGSAAADVPTQRVFLVTTTGGFDGVLGAPIIEVCFCFNFDDYILFDQFLFLIFRPNSNSS